MCAYNNFFFATCNDFQISKGPTRRSVASLVALPAEAIQQKHDFVFFLCRENSWGAQGTDCPNEDQEKLWRKGGEIFVDTWGLSSSETVALIRRISLSISTHKTPRLVPLHGSTHETVRFNTTHRFRPPSIAGWLFRIQYLKAASWYGVTTIRRLLKIIHLVCRIQSLL